MIPRQGDLFLYGTESLICPINRKGSWVGCLGWQRGWARTFFLSNFFPFQPFSFISDKNRLMNVPNSYFFLNIFKNRLKWIKNPNLHDSRTRLRRWYITIPSSDQWCTTIENHRYQWLSYPKTIGKPLIPMVALNHSIQW